MKNESLLRSHWDAKYQNTEQIKLGWYEASPQPSLDLIRKSCVSKDGVILDIGSGSSTLIDHLVADGYTNVIATDISTKGLEITKQRIGENLNSVRFIVDDLTQPTHLSSLKDISIWHDRAVLHFFTEEQERNSYLVLLKRVLKHGGFAIISTFEIGGLTKCSGLNIHQYDTQSMIKFLGSEFKLIRSMSHTYTTTWGQDRPFVYGVFQRI